MPIFLAEVDPARAFGEDGKILVGVGAGRVDRGIPETNSLRTVGVAELNPISVPRRVGGDIQSQPGRVSPAADRGLNVDFVLRADRSDAEFSPAVDIEME